MTGKNDVAVLGVGMHPWGKWGRNFVEYGVAAAEAALDDAGVAWTDMQFVSGADTMRNGYPGYVSGATFAQALGWTGCRVASSYAACASGATAMEAARTRILAGTVRRGPRGRRRHHPEGLPGPERRRPPRRPRLAALPAARRHQPHLLRALRPAPGRPLRRDRRRLRQGEGQERPARPGQPLRPVPQGGHRRGGAGLADGRRPAAPARDLRHVRRRRRDGALARSSTPAGHGHANPVQVTAISTVTPTFPNTVIEMPNFATDSSAVVAPPERHVQGSRSPTPPTRRPASAPTSCRLAEVYDLSAALELDWYEDIGLCKAGRGREAAQRRRHHHRRPHPRQPSAVGSPASARPCPPRPSPRCARSRGSCGARPSGRQVEGATAGITANQGLFGHGSSVLLVR